MPYIPPHRKAAMAEAGIAAPQLGFRRAAAPEPEDAALQKAQWRRLSQGIVGAVNKASKTTVVERAVDLIRCNIERGRGVFCKAIMRSQEANPEMSDLFAALASVINRQFPSVGLLLLKRLMIQWRRYYGRKHVEGVKNEGRFIAQLYTFGVCSDAVVLELLVALLCQDPLTDVEIDAASAIFKEAYRVLEMRNPKAFHEILSLMRDALQADPKMLSKRSESIVEAMLDDVKNWHKTKHDTSFIDPSLLPIVEGNADADMAPHELSLDDPSVGGEGSPTPFGDPETKLDNYAYDADYSATENAYNEMKRVILGPLADEPMPTSDDDGEGVSDWEEDKTDGAAAAAAAAYSLMTPAAPATADGAAPTPAPTAASAAVPTGNAKTGGFATRMAGNATKAINSLDDLKAHLEQLYSPNAPSPFSHEEDIKVRSKIVTSIQSSITAEEAAHKLLKGMPRGAEPITCYLVTEAAAQERIYRDKHALIAAQLCGTGGKMQYFWSALFKYRYFTADSLDAAPLIVNARIFAHLLGTRSIGWDVLEVVDISTSDASQRIFVANVLRHVCEFMSVPKVAERFRDQTLLSKLGGLFPFGDMERVRLSIRFLEGVGGVDGLKTDLEQWYAQQRQLAVKRARE